MTDELLFFLLQMHGYESKVKREEEKNIIGYPQTGWV